MEFKIGDCVTSCAWFMNEERGKIVDMYSNTIVVQMDKNSNRYCFSQTELKLTKG